MNDENDDDEQNDNNREKYCRFVRETEWKKLLFSLNILDDSEFNEL